MRGQYVIENKITRMEGEMGMMYGVIVYNSSGSEEVALLNHWAFCHGRTRQTLSIIAEYCAIDHLDFFFC